jgi:hypothetical protein
VLGEVDEKMSGEHKQFISEEDEELRRIKEKKLKELMRLKEKKAGNDCETSSRDGFKL